MAWDALLGPELLVTNTSEMRKGRPTTAVVAVSSSRVLGTSWAPPRQPRTNGRDDEGCGATDGGAAVATPARWVSLDLRGRRNGAWACVEA